MAALKGCAWDGYLVGGGWFCMFRRGAISLGCIGKNRHKRGVFWLEGGAVLEVFWLGFRPPLCV